MGPADGRSSLPLRTLRRATPGALRPPAAMGQAGRGGPPLVHFDHPDARQLGLVLQSPDEMGAPPGAQPEVLDLANVPVTDPLGVSHSQGPHPVADRPGDHRPGGLVVSLADPPLMAGLLASAAPPQLAPAPRSPLAPARGLAPHLPSPGRGVGKVQVAFGPH